MYLEVIWDKRQCACSCGTLRGWMSYGGGRWRFLIEGISWYNSVCGPAVDGISRCYSDGCGIPNNDGVSMHGGYLLLTCGLTAMYRSRSGPESQPAAHVNLGLSSQHKTDANVLSPSGGAPIQTLTRRLGNQCKLYLCGLGTGTLGACGYSASRL